MRDDFTNGALLSPARTEPWNPAAAPLGDLLAKLLGAVHRHACAKVERSFPELIELASAQPDELKALGFSPAAIERLAALFEFAKRFAEREFRVGVAFRGSGDVYHHFRERLAAERVEHFYAVLLDNKHRKLRDVLLSKGSLTASIVHPRDAFLPVIRYSAAALIFVHNHPSGDPTPSKEDLAITRRLCDVGDILGVRVLDHVVIGNGRYVSFVDDGYWTPTAARSEYSGVGESGDAELVEPTRSRTPLPASGVKSLIR
jgi:DNA repair protein RadC